MIVNYIRQAALKTDILPLCTHFLIGYETHNKYEMISWYESCSFVKVKILWAINDHIGPLNYVSVVSLMD